MREPVKDRIRLEHIQTAIDNIFQYTKDKSIQQLSDDTMLFYATVKNIDWRGCIPPHKGILQRTPPNHME